MATCTRPSGTGNTASSCAPHFERDVDLLRARGVDITLLEVGGQCFVLVRGIAAPVPPWDRERYDILIALPLAEGASLDGMYIELPYQFNGGGHGRVSGAVVQYEGRSFQLVSWHYVDGAPWRADRDDLDSHIQHCIGFFHHRGAVNAA